MTPTPAPVLHRMRRVLLVVCIATWVSAFVLTHTPRQKLPQIARGGTPSHLLGFFALGCMFYFTLAAHGVRLRKRAILVAAALAVYGAFDEITQPLATRNADLYDWFADVIGAVAAAAACHCAWALRDARRAAAKGDAALFPHKKFPKSSRRQRKKWRN